VIESIKAYLGFMAQFLAQHIVAFEKLMGLELKPKILPMTISKIETKFKFYKVDAKLKFYASRGQNLCLIYSI
jgi:hypothetical protein